MINKTRDYSIFKKHEANRKLDDLALKKLENSIKFKNMLNIRPIIVNNKMEIIDGQHRLEIAKRLSLDIFYTIDNNSDDNDIILLNNNQTRWTQKDYLNYYVNKNSKEYIKMNDFMRSLNIIDPNICLYLVGNKGGSKDDKFRCGSFIFPDDTSYIIEKYLYICEVKKIVSNSIIKAKKFSESTKFLRALCILSSKDLFSFDILLKKLPNRLDLLHTCGTTEGYIEMLKAIYNYRSLNPIE